MNQHYPADYLLSTGKAGIPPSVVASLRASSRIAEAAGIRQRTVSLSGHQASVIAVVPSAYRSVFMPLLMSGSLSRIATGTGAIALDTAQAADLHVRTGDPV